MNLLKEYIREKYSSNEEIQEKLLETLSVYFNQVDNILQKTESPIEKTMAIELLNLIKSDSELGEIGFVDLEPQKTIKLNNRNKYYVADFLITWKPTVSVNGVERKLIVECDGHDFHEKTKEQVKKGKLRDRKLFLEGYTVFHFTGSEIYEDVSGCAIEVLEMIRSWHLSWVHG
ncbi:endonuclease domain-containing protein [Salicibibacter halophilus]|nr:DUF559 domain-containing protein [Salicibibacter halophilus]